jgi:2-polyprenyl-6-hydroxyphenyl methylase/3-demethylubiquinone-9 3-methyltransferase
MTQAEARPEPAVRDSVDPAEIAKFSAMAEEWWDPAGKFRPLHKLNPTRLAFVRDRIAGHLGRDPLADRPLAGLSLLDIGCGGGLLAEPLCRLGAEVTGIDASERTIKVASVHAAEVGLAIDYRHAAAEDLAGEGARFDAVLNMEVVEHVADLGAFLAASGALVKPGGAMVVATLNRTPKAFLLGIVGAEYLLRWLPPGTHDWRRFVRPSELARGLVAAGLTVTEIAGMTYNPLTDAWHLSRDTDVNYMVFAVKG